MKQVLVAGVCLGLLAADSGAATVNTAGTGNYTSIQAALNAGETEIVITDSAVYDENVRVGTLSERGVPVTITSTQSGDNRPTIASTTASPGYANARNNVNTGTFAIFSDGTHVSNLIIEGNPDLLDAGGGQYGQAALFIMADGVTIENCLIRPMQSQNGANDIKFPTGLVFVAMEGDPSSHVAKAGGKTSDDLLFKDCELLGVHKNAVIFPDEEDGGYLWQGINSCAATLARCDHYTAAGQDVTVTFDGCRLAYIYDAGLFPSNRDISPRTNGGRLTWVAKHCFFDSFGKFAFRARGGHIVAECCVFTRTNMGHNGDGENSAIAIQDQDGRANVDATITNCLFVNCGGAYAQKGYYGGINNHSGGTMLAENCTFVGCLSGAGVGTGDNGGAAPTSTIVKNCIFHQIGSNLPGAVGEDGITITEENPWLVNGLYPAWELTYAAGGPDQWSAVFSHHKTNSSTMVIQDCLVGDIASEDTRDWATALTEGTLLGCRLTTGYEGPDDEVRGVETVVRGTPVFLNTDLESDRPYELAPDSPGQGMGVNWDACEPTEPPVLNIAPDAAGIALTWPASATGFTLSSTSSLVSPVTWDPVAQAPTVEEGMNKVVLPASAAAEYYRLSN